MRKKSEDDEKLRIDLLFYQSGVYGSRNLLRLKAFAPLLM